jgi:hypothetical protein
MKEKRNAWTNKTAKPSDAGTQRPWPTAGCEPLLLTSASVLGENQLTRTLEPSPRADSSWHPDPLYRTEVGARCCEGARELLLPHLALLQEAGGCHQCVVRVRERSGAEACSARALLM